jgi:O-acetyl-ADP-ribose deacetylase (regulator of RNase III)
MLLFFDANPDVIKALEVAFDDLRPSTSVARFPNIPSVKALISPANSFGFMDGGIDAAYLQYFGKQLQDRLQEKIEVKTKWGELFVGEAVTVATNHERFPWLIAAPTMRTPGRIHDSVDIYLAARAAFNEASLHESVACPGMGTLSGGVHPAEAARVMRLGYDHAKNPRAFPTSWQEARDIVAKGRLAVMTG